MKDEKNFHQVGRRFELPLTAIPPISTNWRRTGGPVNEMFHTSYFRRA
jgi:hypothetical protein